jgi:ABC-type multidrug transport system ATPase subunit
MMITFEHVTKRYGDDFALNDVTFELAPERALALWGPNGAGKTTAIKCLLGLTRYRGTIRAGGYDAARQGRRVRTLIGYVPQELAFYSDLSALETAHFFAALRRADPAEIPVVLAKVELTEHAHKPVGALSGGMKQRLALALALLGEASILVLDEPTSNLDRAGRDHFLHLLAGIKAEGRTVLFTSHRLEEVAYLADEALVMADGRVTRRCAGSALARELGLQQTVKLRLAPELLDNALALLQDRGFAARRNGAGVLVDVPAGAKAAPIDLLTRNAITVTDFEVE